jgi:signal transduction histidine kinase
MSHSFVLSSVFTLAIALIGSIYFNSSGLQILHNKNLQREQELLSNFLVPAVLISDGTEVRKLLSLASDANEKFIVIDRSGNILMPNYEDFSTIKKNISGHISFNDCDNVKTGYQIINGIKTLVSCSALSVNGVDKKQSVGVLVSLSQRPSVWFSSLVFYFFGVVVISLLINIIWFRRVLNQTLLNPLMKLAGKTINIARSPFNCSSGLDGIKGLPKEINEIKNAFKSVLLNLQEQHQQRTESEKKSALLDQAARVAHDIRSPLASMEANLHILMKDISKEKLKMMSLAIQSVRDISNNLLEKYRTRPDAPQVKSILNERDDTNIVRSFLLFSLIDQVVSQKRYEWLNKSCELIFDFSPESKSKWVKAAPSEFKRMISNLLNNAIEACDGKVARIHLTLSVEGGYLELSIADNGMGIPEDMLESYLNGESSKHSGEGLGLSTAKKYIKSIDGQIDISSTLNKGTTVLLKVIHSDPVWYPEQILLAKDDEVVILDDDAAMQSLWAHRLENYPVNIHLFNNYNDAENWITSNLDRHDKIVLLVDYELSSESTNGLMLLKQYGLSSDSYLITSHAEEFSIQKEVAKSKIKLIPKLLANDIPIKLL